MAFAEVSLEVGAPLGSGGYGFKTTITRNAGDFEKRFAKRLEPLFKGNIGQANLRSEMIDHVTTFFNARRGKAQGFRYRFWADYTATATPKDLGDTASTQGVAFLISPNTYACYKVYSWGGQVCYKRITKLVQGTVSVFSNGNPAVGVAIDNTTGIITYSGGGSITWKGEFDLPVRFDVDTLPRVLLALDDSQDQCVDDYGRTLYKFESLPIVELPAESPVFSPVPVAEINKNIDIGFINSSGSETFISEVVTSGSEFEQLYARRLYPLFAGTLGELNLREEIEYWVCLFNVLRGRLTRFRWKNWADYQVTHAEKEFVSGGKIQGVTIPATGDGANTQFQLAKKYISGGQITLKPVYKVIRNSISIYIDGVELSPALYDIYNNELGFLDPLHSGAVITWAGEFDLSVRFDDDSFTGNFKRLPGDNDCEVGVFEVGGLALVEVPVGAFVRATAPPDDIKCPVGDGMSYSVAPSCGNPIPFVLNNTGLPGWNGVIVTNPTSVWTPSNSTSQWIGPSINGSPTAPSPYSLSYSFYTTRTINRIVGKLMVDDQVSDVLVNRVSNQISLSGYTAFSNFILTQGFALGQNTIQFRIVNSTLSGFNPIGLRVEWQLEFIDSRYRLDGGVCVLDESGPYASLAACQAAIPPQGGGVLAQYTYNIAMQGVGGEPGFPDPAVINVSAVSLPFLANNPPQEPRLQSITDVGRTADIKMDHPSSGFNDPFRQSVLLNMPSPEVNYNVYRVVLPVFDTNGNVVTPAAIFTPLPTPGNFSTITFTLHRWGNSDPDTAQPTIQTLTTLPRTFNARNNYNALQEASTTIKELQWDSYYKIVITTLPGEIMYIANATYNTFSGILVTRNLIVNYNLLDAGGGILSSEQLALPSLELTATQTVSVTTVEEFEDEYLFIVKVPISANEYHELYSDTVFINPPGEPYTISIVNVTG